QPGKKFVVIKQLDEGTKERPYPHAIVAGIERYTRKVIRRMGQKKICQNSDEGKPFIKCVINYSHLFPTRYALELLDLKGWTRSRSRHWQRENAKTIKKLLEDCFTAVKKKWVFTMLLSLLVLIRGAVLNGARFYETCLFVLSHVRSMPQCHTIHPLRCATCICTREGTMEADNGFRGDRNYGQRASAVRGINVELLTAIVMLLYWKGIHHSGSGGNIGNPGKIADPHR
ncbi:hypothetical protein DFH09DRAFT_905427, partial [Mycena vulgaris]